MWVTFASGYQVVYQALVVLLVGLIFYAFLNARRQGLGEIAYPVDLPDEVPASWHAEVMAEVKPEKAPKTVKDTKSKK
jgi:hypothetical protein